MPSGSRVDWERRWFGICSSFRCRLVDRSDAEGCAAVFLSQQRPPKTTVDGIVCGMRWRRRSGCLTDCQAVVGFGRQGRAAARRAAGESTWAGLLAKVVDAGGG